MRYVAIVALMRPPPSSRAALVLIRRLVCREVRGVREGVHRGARVSAAHAGAPGGDAVPVPALRPRFLRPLQPRPAREVSQ